MVPLAHSCEHATVLATSEDPLVQIPDRHPAPKGRCLPNRSDTDTHTHPYRFKGVTENVTTTVQQQLQAKRARPCQTTVLYALLPVSKFVSREQMKPNQRCRREGHLKPFASCILAVAANDIIRGCVCMCT